MLVMYYKRMICRVHILQMYIYSQMLPKVAAQLKLEQIQVKLYTTTLIVETVYS